MIATAATLLIAATSAGVGNDWWPVLARLSRFSRIVGSALSTLRSFGSMNIRCNGEHVAVKLLEGKLGADHNQDE